MEKRKIPQVFTTHRCIFMVGLFSIILAIFNAPSLRELQRQGVLGTAQWYMQSLLDQQYNVMWSLLHPQIQAKWANEKAFVTFIQHRFEEYSLQSFILGNVHELPYWVDPETMIQYTQLEAIPVSLQLFPKVTSFKGPPLPPEVMYPSQLFQTLPIILQYVSTQDGKGGNWFILNGGPADLEAPILPPITPTNRIIQVPILMYHHVTPFVSTNRLSDYIRTWVVPPDSFSQQMDYLKMHNYHTITFNQLFDALYYGAPLQWHVLHHHWPGLVGMAA
jgi:hypothetical protein